jgi:hypothetical protein
VITGEDPTVAAALVSLEDGENNTIQRRCSEGLTL